MTARPPWTRRLTAALAVLGLLGLLAAGTAPAARAATDPRPAVSHVVVVGVPGLLWTDIGPGTTPQLWAVAQQGSIGALTVRSARSVTCVLDGWVTLGAGNRARFLVPPEPLDAQFEAPPDPEEQLGGCLPQQQDINLSEVIAKMDASPATADNNSYGARPGALGAAVSCSTAVGRGPVLALHRPGARTELVPLAPASAAGWGGVLTQCPLTVVAMPDLIESTDRARTLAALDERIGVLRTGLPPATELIIVGTSETGLNSSSLHVAIEVGDGVAPGFLTSASTGRAPFVQLIDVAPTVLSRLGIAQPAAMVGQELQPGQPRPPALADAVAELTDADLAARAQGSAGSQLFLWLVVGNVALCAAGFLLRRRGSRGPTVALRTVALVVATLPAATFLANLAPWWRAGAPGPALTALVAGWMVAISLVAGLGPWRRAPAGPAVVVLSVTLLTMTGDVLTGSRLQLSSLLGYNPIVAGRFVGFGNIPFAIYAAGALLVIGAVLHVVPPRRQGLVLLLAAVATVVVDGTPGIGSDFGGVLALVPAFTICWLVLSGRRASVGRLGLAVALGAVVVLGIAVLDYLRPADQQTHLGRFVGQVLDGSALTVVQRKAGSNINLLLHSPLTLLVPVFLLTLWWLLRRGGPLSTLLQHRELRAVVAALAVAALIGFLLNDSGVAVPAAMGWLVVPLALSVAAAYRLGDSGRHAGSGRVDVPVPPDQGVTVNSRDSAAPAD